MRDALLDVGGRRAGDRQAEGGIVINGLPGQQPEVLEYHRHAFGRAGDQLAVDQEFAFADVDEAGNAAQQRGLAATARAHDAEDFLLTDGEIEVMEGDYGSVEEQLARILCDDREAIAGRTEPIAYPRPGPPAPRYIVTCGQ